MSDPANDHKPKDERKRAPDDAGEKDAALEEELARNEAEQAPPDPSEPDPAPADDERLDPGAPDGAAEDPIEALKAETAELKDQLLRALAESENLRRRLQKEKEDAAKYAAAPLARDILGVADNLSRALAAVPEDEAQDNETLKNLLAGVEMTQRELEQAFAKHGIEKIEPVGEKLNPHHHEAMFEVPTDDQPAGTIAQVIQPGYLLADRLLRPARVGVAKPAPKTDDGA